MTCVNSNKIVLIRSCILFLLLEQNGSDKINCAWSNCVIKPHWIKSQPIQIIIVSKSFINITNINIFYHNRLKSFNNLSKISIIFLSFQLQMRCLAVPQHHSHHFRRRIPAHSLHRQRRLLPFSVM